MKTLATAAALACLASAALSGPLTGKTYIIELVSTHQGSGYAEFLIPPFAAALDSNGMRPANGPGADYVVNILTDSDVGRWTGTGAARAWTYTVTITVGISPEPYTLPLDGTPAFGVRATLLTPNPDREDELKCLVKLTTRTAVTNYRPTGMYRVDGHSCLRRS